MSPRKARAGRLLSIYFYKCLFNSGPSRLVTPQIFATSTNRTYLSKSKVPIFQLSSESKVIASQQLRVSRKQQASCTTPFSQSQYAALKGMADTELPTRRLGMTNETSCLVCGNGTVGKKLPGLLLFSKGKHKVSR